MQVLRPQTTADTLRLLADGGEDTKIIAGGTALMLMMRNGLVMPEQLVSLDRLSELDRVTVEPDAVRLGALVSLRSIERSAELATVLPTLSAAVGLVANHRIRQRATIGGCVSEADYASDPPAVLTTLGCEVHVVGIGTQRWIPLSEFLVDYYQTVLQPGELVTEVRIPRPSPTARTTYLKYISRSAEDRPCVGVAAHVDLDSSGRCTDVRVAVAGATATPFTVVAATEACRGAKPDKTAWDEVAAAYSAAISPIGDARGSAAYRKHVTGELVRRALQTASTGTENGAFRL
ncbi:FAD binding domain-containing protein [Pseudonocardia bannensis]|uniref:Xanthine dehydrogenase family protein subunit M n=1 Tax=Pseudonocardia bannensis TaxID=630973 RepID=A0A848DQJ6_9PSEU|nr:xanthine dehydrogenase family protein subunit M [Pseudonocardia bannensis]NMH94584.1 xanthine dehydrogenase family protein subunit M [Pseudonocardia bannensis]